MKSFVRLIFACSLLTLAASAQEPVIVTVEPNPGGYNIPPNFTGVSIFNGTQVLNHRGVPGNLFSGTNTQLITLFKNAGLHHLRLGATGSPTSGAENLNHDDIDSLFAFAKATGIKVIYSLHFKNGAATAKYVWDHYRPYVDCFAFDNEPDSRSGQDETTHTNYFDSWRSFALEVTAAAPGSKFAGPDAAGRTLVKRFVAAEKDSGVLALITQHTYIGGNPRKKGIDLPQAIENILSPGWVTTNYPQLYRSVLQPVQKAGLPFRLTELDDHVHGVTNASDAFIAALWALDCMHWWAAHGAAGVNFQNTEWLPTDTFYLDTSTNYQIHAKAYGIRAFDLGGHGRVASASVDNEHDLNLTAYAVSDSTNFFVTIINKEHGPGARTAGVSIRSQNLKSENAAAMLLTAPDGNLQATNGVTLGGATITNNALWQGQWTLLKLSTNGYLVTVPASSAAVVRLSSR